MSETELPFVAGGRVGALMRTHDWSRSPLGHPSTWPQSLRTIVSVLLQSQFPMFVAWGKDLGFLYNDPYAEILGAKHPAAIGRCFYDIWSEICLRAPCSCSNGPAGRPVRGCSKPCAVPSRVGPASPDTSSRSRAGVP
jgi:hypothetical protein